MVKEKPKEKPAVEKSSTSCECKTKINVLRIIAFGIVFMIIATIIHNLFAIASMSYYSDPNYFSVWSKIMMPGEGAPPASFYGYSMFFSFIGGLIFALVFALVGCCVCGKTDLKRGLSYGFLIFLISVPGYLSMILIINLPSVLISIWALESLIIYLITGAIITKILK